MKSALQRQELKETRIVKRDLVYLVGLSERLANESLLAKQEYFGQYGPIRKIAVNRDKPFGKGSKDPLSFSCYTTFVNNNDAALAIIALDGVELEGQPLKACFGMTKYCSYFIKNAQCPVADCLYFHKLAEDQDCFYKVV